MTDLTLACDDANPKLITVADVDAEKLVEDSLVAIWNMKSGRNADICLVEILKLMLGRDSEDET